MFKIFKLTLVATLLLAAPAMAETIKVENGVTVKTGVPDPAPSANIAKPTDGTAEKKAEPEQLFMKPIVENRSKPAKPKPEETTKFVEKKEEPIAAKESPFKKSQDANSKETVKKPEPTPQVQSKPLEDNDITKDIKNLDSIKDRATKELTVESGIGESGLPIPRFVSLKSGEANARTGPGDTYPIRWVYQRKNLPVEITAEFKLWRRIKDFDGEQSWAHQALLSSNRYAILNREAVAFGNNDGSGSEVARFKRGVQVKVTECREAYCEVEYGRIDGWVKKKDLWGIYPEEKFD